jgi:tRNA (guanine26-N2/guanine27-N2)-dimethyltransferase
MQKGKADFGFPTEIVREGEVELVVPRLEAFVASPSEYAPSKAPVFYNPAMELNRDLAVLALQTYQKIRGEEIVVCEPLAGCGIRGIRYAKEVKGVKKVLMSDLNPKAVKLARFNAEINGLSKQVSIEKEDANLVLSVHAAPRKRFGFIDIDPFGSPAPYLDSAVRALRDKGMLALTATDLAPLCGVHSKACMRKYGGKPLRTEYCHELAVRLLAACLARNAAKHDIGIRIVFSHSTDHYIRLYATAEYGAKKADKTLRNLGYVVHCFRCFHREVITQDSLFGFPLECRECGMKLETAGSLWIGEIVDKAFCGLMMEEANRRRFKQHKRILKLLSTIYDEAELPPTYFVVDKICGRLKINVPPLEKVVRFLKSRRFKAGKTHFNSRGVKTDASAKVVTETLKKLNLGFF